MKSFPNNMSVVHRLGNIKYRLQYTIWTGVQRGKIKTRILSRLNGGFLVETLFSSKSWSSFPQCKISYDQLSLSIILLILELKCSLGQGIVQIQTQLRIYGPSSKENSRERLQPELNSLKSSNRFGTRMKPSQT